MITILVIIIGIIYTIGIVYISLKLTEAVTDWLNENRNGYEEEFPYLLFAGLLIAKLALTAYILIKLGIGK